MLMEKKFKTLFVDSSEFHLCLAAIICVLVKFLNLYIFVIKCYLIKPYLWSVAFYYLYFSPSQIHFISTIILPDWHRVQIFPFPLVFNIY